MRVADGSRAAEKFRSLATWPLPVVIQAVFQICNEHMSSSSHTPTPQNTDQAEIARQIRDMGEWFHNLNLHGVPTAPNHFLGDFPNIKWKEIQKQIPERLDGTTVLDIGCNGGFYSIEFKRRGADYVLGIDVDERYLKQARFAARTLDLDIEFRRCSVYDLESISGRFDYVVFMGVFYHLRYPLLGLDLAVKKIQGQMIFQTMLRGSQDTRQWEPDYPFWKKDIFLDPAFPVMYFIEKEYSSDPTNWWIPNRAAAEGILRSAGLEIVAHPEEETWICKPASNRIDRRYVLDLELAGELVPDEGEQSHGRSSDAVE
jgi:tRNA (mo5U34)-methyltransferase